MNITPTAIAGLGMTQLGKVYGRTPAEFAVEAVTRAAADAGLALADIDGLLVNPGSTTTRTCACSPPCSCGTCGC